MRKKWQETRLYLNLVAIIAVMLTANGCFLTPKRDVMRTSVAKTTTRKTSKPLVIVSAPEERTTVVAPQETIESTVEYGSSEPVVKSRSIWTRWWWWALLVVGMTYFGLWPLLIHVLKKLRAKTHALVSLIKQIDVYKDTADPTAKQELKTILKTQDPITKKEVDKVRNGT